jgi:hypothetical protein
MAARQRTPAKRTVKPELSELEAYIPKPLQPKDYTPQIVATVIGLTAVGLAIFGLVCNATYLSAFGAPGLSSWLLTGLGVAIETLALGLPSLATVLDCRGDKRGSYIAWSLWVPAVAMVLINSCGFSSRYINDSTFAREQVTDQASGRKAELANLRIQRQAIAELRSVASIDATLASLKPSGKAHERASIARAEAINRDTLDTKISTLESALASAPAIASADPGAAVAADMLGWMTHGIVVPSIHDFQIIRLIILTLMPAFSGPLLGLSLRLARTGRA